LLLFFFGIWLAFTGSNELAQAIGDLACPGIETKFLGVCPTAIVVEKPDVPFLSILY
jgi:hypothetical protein